MEFAGLFHSALDVGKNSSAAMELLTQVGGRVYRANHERWPD
nr:Uncharacterised protein [Salmonella sp. NCTC 7297]